MNMKSLPGYILKVDFAKAFDLVNWEFLLELLKARGFEAKWLAWIENILSSTKANVLVNGSPNGYIRYQRGLRQGACYLRWCSIWLRMCLVRCLIMHWSQGC